MTRLPRSRVAVAPGLTVGTAVVVLALGTTASAAPQGARVAAPTAPAGVVAGTPFTVSGTGCQAPGSTGPVRVVALTDEAEATDDVAVAVADPDGEWSVTLSFPPGTVPGAHEVGAACRGSVDGESTEFDYPIVTMTVTGTP